MKIVQTTVADLVAAPTFHELLAKYGEECAIAGMPPPSAKLEIYKKIEQSGLLHVFAAFEDEVLIGFITVLLSELPHYGVNTGITESFFVAKEQRKTGAGLALLHAAEKLAETYGSPGLLVSAPWGGVLADVLPRCGYEVSNVVFFRKFYNA